MILLLIVYGILLKRILLRKFISRNAIALTFDDGPRPGCTERLLSLLSASSIPATFFLRGERAAEHPELVKLIHAGGHAIGNHSFSHPSLLGLPAARVKQEIFRTSDILEKILPGKVILFRPPYGRWSPYLIYLLHKSGMKLILWNCGSKDYRNISPEEYFRKIRKKLVPGAIITLHDGVGKCDKLLQIVEMIIQYAVEKGWDFMTIPGVLQPKVSSSSLDAGPRWKI